MTKEIYRTPETVVLEERISDSILEASMDPYDSVDW